MPDYPWWFSNRNARSGGYGSATTDGIYVSDDFVTETFVAASGPLWVISGSAGYGTAVGNHYGILTIPDSTNISSFLGGNTSIPFTSLAKATVRFVLAPTAGAVLATGTKEWFCGFQEDGGTQQYGALFSNAQGYGNATLPADGGVGFVDATTGLVAGTYNNVAAGKYGYVQTLVQPALNQWLDLIISWTPTACRFYAGPYTGTPPPLKATITNNLVNSATPMIRPTFNNSMQVGSVVSIDRIEYMLQPVVGSPRFIGAGLLNL